jgi:hypothetical protein
MSISRPAAALLLTTLVSGCSTQGPSLAGYPGLQSQVMSFYDDRATERSASCPDPQMRSVTSHRVVEETLEKVVMDIRYRWMDDSQAMEMEQGGSVVTCQDWSERTFTFARTGSGGLVVQSMTGPQKRV